MDGERLASICRGTFRNCPSVKSPSYRTICDPTNAINQLVTNHELTRTQASIHYLFIHFMPLKSFSLPLGSL